MVHPFDGILPSDEKEQTTAAAWMELPGITLATGARCERAKSVRIQLHEVKTQAKQTNREGGQNGGDSGGESIAGGGEGACGAGDVLLGLTGVTGVCVEKWKNALSWTLRFVSSTASTLYPNKKCNRASLVAQWLGICLPMQGTRVRALVREDPTCHGATRPVYHNY